jgi:hypothetical protein
MIISKRVTVGTEPTLLVAPSAQHQQVQLLNAGQEVVRIGGADVTANAYGLPRLPKSERAAHPVHVPAESERAIFGLVAANTSEVNVWVQVP